MATPPTILSPLTLPSLLHHILATQSHPAPTTLIICSTKEAFLQNLVHAIHRQHPDPDQTTQASHSLLQLAAPTLHNLFTARHVNLAFCSSVQALLAYLTVFEFSALPAETGTTPHADRITGGRIILVNPLALHASTSFFSVQGLSRTFAAAVETSLRVNAHLIMAECVGHATHSASEVGEGGEELGEARREEPGAGTGDPWDREVSILNVSAKKFGDRPWAGRTVKVSRVAARWFRFHKIDG